MTRQPGSIKKPDPTGEGIKARTQIDNEVVRGLMIANGGGAVALLAFLETAFTTQALEPLRAYVVAALLFFHVGIVTAMIHNRYRRLCSWEYEQADYHPEPIRRCAN